MICDLFCVYFGETGLYYDHCCPVKREEIEFVK